MRLPMPPGGVPDATRPPATAPHSAPRRQGLPGRLALLLVWLLFWPAEEARAETGILRINEIMYHPAHPDEAGWEWIELYNTLGVDLDLSGWSLRSGTDYEFPAGTVVRGKSYLVVASRPENLTGLGIAGVLGPWTQRLSNAGERLELRNNNGRVIDSLRYGVEGDWPVAPDGGGPSLAKRRVHEASGDPKSWSPSRQHGGTPGRENFPETGDTLGPKPLVTMSASWRYLDSGAAPSTWTETDFDDNGWSSGAPPFVLGEPGLPGSTPLAAGRTAYYFRAPFEWNEGPGPADLQLHLTVDDGAVVYLNGAEVVRHNLPPGPLLDATPALGSHPQPVRLGPLTLPSAALRPGRNVLAIALHQSSGGHLTPPGLSLVEIGGTLFGENIATRPDASPFAKDVLTLGLHPFHRIAHLNDGRYSNTNSWIGETADSFAGIAFAPALVGRVAWGRDNANVNGDRTAGTYTLEYTTVPNPTAATTSWRPLGSIHYPAQGTPGSPLSLSLRHVWSFPPVMATGLRLLTPSGAAIDELEIAAPAPLPVVLFKAGEAARPGNLARAGVAFAKDALTGYPAHATAHLNDGVYGNNNSWIGNSEASFAGIRLAGLSTIHRVAFGRDNTGTYSDRSAGNYLLQYTQAANPGPSTPDSAWITLGPVFKEATRRAAVRHEYEFPPVQATGIRLFAPGNGAASGACIDELEVYGEAPDLFLSATLSGALRVPPARSVTFNEFAPEGAGTFWVELANGEGEEVSLESWVLQASGSVDRTHLFPSGTRLPAGGFLVVTEEDLGFRPRSGDRLFLQSPGRWTTADAVVVKKTARARQPDRHGRWLFPSEVTPGAANRFDLRQDVVINEIMYHPPPVLARAAEVETTTWLELEAVWKFHDAGPLQGLAWTGTAFDDSSWSSGPALLHHETAAFPARRNTLLQPGQTTYYFRTTFQVENPSEQALPALKALVDDGAVFYLNGTEFHRENMPPGPVGPSTYAAAPIGNAVFTGAIPLPRELLRPGSNLLAVEVHQAGAYAYPPQPPPAANAGLTLSAPAGFAISWDGNDGEYEDLSFPALAPDNAALASQGAVAFGSSEFGGVHKISHANNGRYGNSDSWLANISSTDPVPYIGIRFAGPVAVTNIAWGRDNGNAVTDPCGGGVCTDRSLGTYTLQFTTLSNPGPATLETGIPATGWATFATVTYTSAQPGFRPWLRHRYEVAQNGAPIQATGIRIKVSNINLAMDEVEVNAGRDIGHADVVFGAEIVSTRVLAPAVSFQESNAAWLELYNRGSAPVNLTGWRLDEGIDYHFPFGTVLPPQGYLVVAKDPAALRALHPDIAVLGPFTNRLSRGSDFIALKDAGNNPVNELRYFDAAPWPEQADGGGSSIELRDPRADNARPEAWAASDERGKTGWTSFSYEGVAAAEPSPSNTRWKEFVLGLLDAGELLIDDLRVEEMTTAGPVDLIQNGSFTRGFSGWRILGNHTGTLVDDPDNPGNTVLHLKASGPTDDMHNHVETTFALGASIVNGRTYRISFRAKWLGGSRQVLSRLYFNRLPWVAVLPLPERLGTPGARNSTFLENAGPTGGQLSHSPVVPAEGEGVRVRVALSDPDGVAEAALFYRQDAGPWNSLPMSGTAAGHEATLPGMPAGTLVQFYVQATDTQGAVGYVPAGGPSSRALFKVDDGTARITLAPNLRILLTPEDTAHLFQLTNVMSNARLGCTVIDHEREAYYDAGIRLKGSQSGRPLQARVGFNIEFPADRLYRGESSRLVLDRSGGWRFGSQFGQDEILIKHLLSRGGTVPGHYPDLVRILGPRPDLTGSAMLQLDPYSNRYLEAQYPNGSRGVLFEYDAVYVSQETVDGNPESYKKPHPYEHPPGINVDISDLGQDKESYRWHFRIKNHRDADDYSRMIELARAFSLAGSELQARMEELVDLEEWMAVFAWMSLCGVNDAYTQGNNHNIRIYFPPEGRAQVFPWDWDFAFHRPVNAPLWGDMNLSRVIALTPNRRLFLGYLLHQINTLYNPEYLQAWADHYDDFLPGQDFSSIVTYVRDRGNHIKGQLPAHVPFSITTRAGQDFETNTTSVLLEGTGGIGLRSIQIAGPADRLQLQWTSLHEWRVEVPLILGQNRLEFRVIGFDGKVQQTRVLNVITTALGGGLDTDGDGIPDAWEKTHQLNPNRPDSGEDPDGDGLTNLQEYWSGTDPKEASSRLALQVARASSGEILLRFRAAPGRRYSLFARESLQEGEWQLLRTFPSASSSREVQHVEPPAGETFRFFLLSTP